MKRIKSVAYFLSCLLFVISAQADLGEPLNHLPVQDGGRLKPFKTFAREKLQLIYGKESYKSQNPDSGKKTKRSASEIVFTWIMVPEHWLKIPIVQIRNNGLKEALGYTEEVDKKRGYFTPEELLGSDRLALLIQELNSKRQRQEKLDPYFQAVQTLEGQLTTFQFIRMGQALRILPPPPESESSDWTAIAKLEGPAKEKFANISKSFISSISAQIQDKGKNGESAEKLKSAVDDFISYARNYNPKSYADESLISKEVHLLAFKPFMWTWILFLFGTVFAFAALITQKDRYRKCVWVLFALGLLIQTYGMYLRVIITGRPPVSNMYETVIWVGWGAVFFAMFMEKFRANNMAFIGSGLVGTLCLILSDMAPVVLDPSLSPLEPVLRDNFWLVVHVIIIVSSYAGFFLAFAIGDLLLVYYLIDENRFKQQIKEGVNSIYRGIQIGIVLLALGIITGGIWADYSWGRFWGWDPKETWALIALLAYVAVLHGRLVGWIKDFGMAVTAVISFSLVIMAWYGVNFVLGAGLHTYGFGAGGVEVVSAFVAAHLLFVVYVITVRQSRLKIKKAD